MDFFETIEEYEKQISEKIKRRLNLFLENQYNLTRSPEAYSNNKLFNEITSSKALHQLIMMKKKRNKKLSIMALNISRNKTYNCFGQQGLDNHHFCNIKNELMVFKAVILGDIYNEIQALFMKEKNKAKYYSTQNTMRILNPIKVYKGNRYKEENIKNGLIKNNKKREQEKIKENRLAKIKQENMAQLKQRIDQLARDDDILMKTNCGNTRFNFESKFGPKGKNKKRILSCRVVIQDKKG